MVNFLTILPRLITRCIVRHVLACSFGRVECCSVRKDIADLYASYQFILAPTFKMVKEITDFLDHSHVLRRDEHDKSPRRPLTAVRTFLYLRFREL